MQIGCTHKDHKMGFKEGDDEEEEEINQSNSFLFQLTTKLQLHSTVQKGRITDTVISRDVIIATRTFFYNIDMPHLMRMRPVHIRIGVEWRSTTTTYLTTFYL